MTDALVVVAAPGDVKSTVGLITAALQERRVPLLATIDHAAGAREAGLQLGDEVLLIFGSPAVGTALMQADPPAGVDLPLRMLVWSKSGGTHIAYHDPRELADRYELDGQQAVLTALNELLEHLVTTAVNAGVRGSAPA
jgi:uncharacterized protein (DUF302 family)